MNKFKVGDRVAIYNDAERETGSIVSIRQDCTLVVMNKPGDIHVFDYHPKQCRRLIKQVKAKLKFKVGDFVWHSCYGAGVVIPLNSSHSDDIFIFVNFPKDNHIVYISDCKKINVRFED